MIGDSDKFLVMGCDGVWEILTMDEICDTIDQRIRTAKPKNKNIASVIEEILDRAIAPDTTINIGCDNMSFIVIYLKNFNSNF